MTTSRCASTTRLWRHPDMETYRAVRRRTWYVSMFGSRVDEHGRCAVPAASPNSHRSAVQRLERRQACTGSEVGNWCAGFPGKGWGRTQLEQYSYMAGSQRESAEAV
jgi:hypothetical protein